MPLLLPNLHFPRRAAAHLLGRIPLWLAFVNAGIAAQPVRILALGDSLTAGYGLQADAAFPAVLERDLAREIGSREG